MSNEEEKNEFKKVSYLKLDDLRHLKLCNSALEEGPVTFSNRRKTKIPKEEMKK